MLQQQHTLTDGRVYVACLAAYNAGKLHGRWIDCTQGADYIHAEIADMLTHSPEPDAEEWAIHDADFWGLHIDEYTSIESLAEWAEALEGCDNPRLIAELRDTLDTDESIEDAIAYHEDHYQGAFDNLTRWAENYIDMQGCLRDVPENIAWYFDYELYGKQNERDGAIFTIWLDGDCHVYTNG